MNIPIFNAINSAVRINYLLDVIAILAAKYLLYIFAIYLIYLWFFKSEHRSAELFATYSALIGLGINFLITLFYFHPRPFMIHIGKLLIVHSTDASFPSDHATFMFAIALTFLHYRGLRIIGMALFLLSLIGGLARVYAGLHFPFDIAGSFLVALFATAISCLLLKKYLAALNRFIIRSYENTLMALLPKIKKLF